MNKEKIAITLDKQSVIELDRLINEDVFQSRSQAIQDAVREKLQRLKRTRLTSESAKLNATAEKKLANEGLATDVTQWPVY